MCDVTVPLITKRAAISAYHSASQRAGRLSHGLLYARYFASGPSPMLATASNPITIVVTRVARRHRELRRIEITQAQMGREDPVVVNMSVDRTFVPALIAPLATKDARPLGIRLFRVYVELQ